MEPKTNLTILNSIALQPHLSLTSLYFPHLFPLSIVSYLSPVCLRLITISSTNLQDVFHLICLPFICVCFLSVYWISLPALFCTAQSVVLPASPARSSHFATGHSPLTLNQTDKRIQPSSHLQ